MWWKDEEEPAETADFEGDRFSEERCKIDPNDHLWHSYATHLPPLFPYSALDGEICSCSNPGMSLKGAHVWSVDQPAETGLCRSYVNVWSWWHWFCYMFLGFMFRGGGVSGMCVWLCSAGGSANVVFLMNRRGQHTVPHFLKVTSANRLAYSMALNLWHCAYNVFSFLKDF